MYKFVKAGFTRWLAVKMNKNNKNNFKIPVNDFKIISHFRGPMESHFVRGEHTLKVPMSLFRENRERLVDRLRGNPGVPKTGAFVVLQGGSEIPFNDTDINWPFRQARQIFPPFDFRLSISHT